MRRASKRDAVEPDIRRRAEALGFLWLENTASTKGRPDACLLRNGHTYWCEVKAPSEPFTRAQLEEFPRIIAHGVPVYVLERPEDVDRLLSGALRAWAPDSITATGRRGQGSRAKKPREFRPGYDRARATAELCSEDCCGLSHLPGRHGCHLHDPWPRMATVENSLLPAPRNGTSDSRSTHKRITRGT